MLLNIKFRDKLRDYVLKIEAINLPVFTWWWNKYGLMLFNDLEETIERHAEENAISELTSLKDIINNDAKIDKADQNTINILHHLDTFLEELNDTEVDYNESEEDREAVERMEENAP